MTKILFVDIPTVPAERSKDIEKIVGLKYRIQDIIYAKHGNLYSFQRKLKQFSRCFLTMGGLLRRKGHQVVYVNYYDTNLQDIKRMSLDFDILGMSCYTGFANRVLRVIREVKETNPKILTILGGYHATPMAENLLRKRYVDVVARGEGEKQIVNLADSFPNVSFSGIKGISYKREGIIVHNDDEELLKPGEIPLPDYSLLPGELKGYNFNIPTMRGCGNRCAFCQNGFFWKTVRMSPIKDVMAELKFLGKEVGPRLIHFCDNVFTYDRARAIKLCRSIRKARLPFCFSCDIRGGSIDQELIGEMEKAGFIKICIGFEDASKEVLDRINKGLDFQENVKSARLIKMHSNMMVEAYWIVGLPGTNLATFNQNIDEVNKLLREGTIDVVATSTTFVPLPGTDIFTNPSRYDIKIKTRRWESYLRSSFEPVYSINGLSGNDLKTMFVDFEKNLVTSYLDKLGMTVEQVEKLHPFVLQKTPEELRWMELC